MLQNNSYYGGFDTSTFSEVYPNLEAWNTDFQYFKSSISFFGPFKNETEMVKNIYYALASEYAFSHHIGGRDQWKLMLWSRIMEYGPFLEKELEVQKSILSMNLSEFEQGGKAIYNTALNPGTAPSDTSLTELQYINQQNVTNYKKSKPEAYMILTEILNKNLIKDFLLKFKNLFISVAYPDYPLYYYNDPSQTTLEGGN